MIRTFGSLTQSVQDISNFTKSECLEFLFKNSQMGLGKLAVAASECQMALENLERLTVQLQTKRLRYNAKSACKYFTL